jgi:hypothetical protein
VGRAGASVVVAVVMVASGEGFAAAVAEAVAAPWGIVTVAGKEVARMGVGGSRVGIGAHPCAAHAIVTPMNHTRFRIASRRLLAIPASRLLC